jgi:hypothetical protein
MSESHRSIESPKPGQTQEATTRKAPPGEKVMWETPKMEDVSEEVMAQPYIRFT